MANDEFAGFDKDPYETPPSMIDDAGELIDDPYRSRTEHEYLAPDGRRRATLVLLGLTLALNVADLIILIAFRAQLEAAYATDDLMDDNAATVLVYGTSSMLTLLMAIAYFTVFLTWLYRTYKNLYWLAQPNDSPPRYTPGWAVGGWFVPIVNLFRPYQVVCDIFRISAPEGPLKDPWTTSRLAQMWWTVWLFSAVLANAAGQFDNIYLLIASDFLDLLSRVLTVTLVISASRLQAARHAALSGGAGQRRPL